MPLYRITATREILYEFDIEAESEDKALAEMNLIELSKNVEQYAYDWLPLNVTDIEEEGFVE